MMNPNSIVLIQGVASLIAVVVIGGYAQYQRVLCEKMEGRMLAAHGWIDEIIEALKEKDEAVQAVDVARLVDDRTGDVDAGNHLR